MTFCCRNRKTGHQIQVINSELGATQRTFSHQSRWHLLLENFFFSSNLEISSKYCGIRYVFYTDEFVIWNHIRGRSKKHKSVKLHSHKLNFEAATQYCSHNHYLPISLLCLRNVWRISEVYTGMWWEKLKESKHL